MEAVLYLSFVLLVFCLSRAAMPRAGGDVRDLRPDVLPPRIVAAIRLAVQGVAIERVRVAMDGPCAVRYLVRGRRSDGSEARLEVLGDGTVRLLDAEAAAPALPEAVNRCLCRCLPSFRPALGTVRLVRGVRSFWYEMEGVVADDQAVSLKISPDGSAFLVTVSELHASCCVPK
ncbi:MAG: hypothetical protein AB9872_08295 [Solidesulfovibrio sp.]